LTSIMSSTGERDFGGPTAGGERTAELVPGANLVILGDMGHDLPMPLWPFMVDVIAAHTTRSP